MKDYTKNYWNKKQLCTNQSHFFKKCRRFGGGEIIGTEDIIGG